MKKDIKKKAIILISISLLIITVDQIIKLYIERHMANNSTVFIKGILNITYAKNTGGAFGLGSNNSIVLTMLSLVLICAIIVYAFLEKNKINNLTLSFLSFIIGGGLGNLIDRIFRGYVIDYIDINPLFNYPIFNFADICIVLGIILIAITLLIQKEK